MRPGQVLVIAAIVFASLLGAALHGRSHREISASRHADVDGSAIEYEISLVHPEKHLFHVRMKIPEVSGEVVVQMPAWNALYQIRDFSSHVEQLEAHVGTQNAPFEKIDKQSWRIQGNGTVQIDYGTFWDEAGPFATQLNAQHAFINPAMVLLYVPGRTGDTAQLSLSGISDDWRVASPLKLNCAAELGNSVCVANPSTYDAIVDAPVEAGKFTELQVSGIDPPVRAVVHGEKWDKKRMEEALRRICAYEVKLMDGAPYKDYTFFVHLGRAAGGAGGGMEHANSTAIAVRLEEDFPNVAAHEFFHLWNVKRIRPASLEPVDYSKEQYTRALWFAEGVTSTYAAYTMVRTGLWSKGLFYEDLSEQIGELQARPANHWQSAEESSLDAWLEKYPLYNRPDISVSYYTKGQVLGMLLDILIRDQTDNEKSLDDVLRSMNDEFAKQNKGYRDSLDIRLTAEKVTGQSFEEFFRRYVASAEDLPYQRWLPLAGLELKTVEHRHTSLGFSAAPDENGLLVVRSVDPESGAWRAGLRIDDVIVSWNGIEPPRDLERWSYSQRKGSIVHLTVRRDEKNSALDIPLGETVEISYRIEEEKQADAKARRIRDGILRGVTQPVKASIP